VIRSHQRWSRAILLLISGLVRLGQHGSRIEPQAGLVGCGDMLEQLVQELVVVAGLDRGAAIAIERYLDAMVAGDRNAGMFRVARQPSIKRSEWSGKGALA
jgi:hypothetical protein